MGRSAKPSKPLWSGRFTQKTSDRLRRLNDSFAFDRELLQDELEASSAWAAALAGAGALTASEAKSLQKALAALSGEISESEARASGYEDVHSYVEGELRKRVGALAGKIHTGRSRNDQVATDLRLWLRRAFDEARVLTLDLAEALAARAADEASTPMPGYTHLKRAEPVTFGHWCLAYAEMLLRDADRLSAARARANECPLGSGALAGTPLRLDRAKLAKALGFDRPTANSLDAVSDRDAAAEYLFAVSLLLSHLSRLAEDLIFFSSDEAAFVELPDALATGSSRMPHKKNPDLLELARGQAGRAIGDLAGLLAVMKGLPLAYDKDMQLDKEPLFRTRTMLADLLPALTELVHWLHTDRDSMREAASNDLILATELADAIAARGVPFREAHEIVGKRIAEAAKKNTTLRELGPGHGITRQDLAQATVEKVLAKKNTLGGTAPRRVSSAAKDTRKRIAALRRKP